VVVLESGRDGVEQITEAIEERRDVGAVHIVSHGSDGSLTLGNSKLSAYNVDRYRDAIKSWQASLTEGADLLIYGCDFAGSAQGREMVEVLSALTGADVAASTDKTGLADRGGDWELEYEAGDIETGIAFSAELQENWRGTLATYEVWSTLDDGSAGTLRWAINQSNATTSVDDDITFNIGGGGVQTIALGTALPDIDDTVNIDGTTQSGFAGEPLIVITTALGFDHSVGDDAMYLGGDSDGSTIRGLIFNGDEGLGFDSNIIEITTSNNTIVGNWFGLDADGVTGIRTGGDGIDIGGSAHGNIIQDNVFGVIDDDAMQIAGDNTIVQGNYFGTDKTGMVVAVGVVGTAWDDDPVPGIQSEVILLRNGAQGTIIGGTLGDERNVIGRGSRAGIQIGVNGATPPSNTTIQGNYIGVNAAGNSDVAGGFGIFGGNEDGIRIVAGSTGNLIGGTAPGAGNVISGVGDDAIVITDSSGNTVQGNIIGLNADLTLGDGNVEHGILINGTGATLAVPVAGASDSNIIGGIEPGAGNIIADHGGYGVLIHDSGHDFNTIRGNSIYSNTNDPPTIPTDPDIQFWDGANESATLDPPVLDPDPVSNGVATAISGTFTGAASSTFTIDFYASQGTGEGQAYLGSTTVTTDGGGSATFTATVPVSVTDGNYITATATNAAGSTSMFSNSRLMFVSVTTNFAPTASDDAYSVTQGSTLNVDWWDEDWGKRQKLSFDNLGRGDLSDFPVLVQIDSATATQMMANGEDLRFVDPDGGVLAYEIEDWNPGGTSYIWVKVPNIDAGSDTDFIWMYYDNSGVSAGEDPDEVWDTNFEAVWHLDEDPDLGLAGDINDSTANNNDGTAETSMTSADLVSARIGDGLVFDGTDDLITAPQIFSGSIDATDLTYSAWIKIDAFNNWGAVLNQGRYEYEVVTRGAPDADGLTISNDGGDDHNYGGSALSTGTWYYVSAVKTGTEHRLIVYNDSGLLENAFTITSSGNN
jgi:parallel beta-helix repeat protein